MNILRQIFLLLLSFSVLSSTASAQFLQQGPKLVGSDAVGGSHQGRSASLSSDGNTAIIGGYGDNGLAGAAWVYTRASGAWTQQGAKLVGNDTVGIGYAGVCVAISADGNTAIVGGYADNAFAGAAWVYTRTAGVWSQQGSKLVGTGAAGNAFQGNGVALSADGNTAAVGGYQDNGGIGAVWVYTRTAGVWSQQGSKLVGTSAIGASGQGVSVSLSANGNTLIVGGPFDNGNNGATWIFTRNGSVWSQEPGKIVANNSVGTAYQGYAVAVSADGYTFVSGGYGDDGNHGAAWIYSRIGGVWTQKGKFIGSGGIGAGYQGLSVSISTDGNTILVGGDGDNGNVGAAWVYGRHSGVWSQQGSKLVGSGAVGSTYQGSSVSLSGDGNTAILGGPYDNSNLGAAWVYNWTRSSLVAYYPFNGNANDESGNGNDFAVNGAVLTADRFGHPASAYSFNGSSNFMKASATDLPPAERTVSFWFKTPIVSNKPYILGYGGESPPNDKSWIMAINTWGHDSYTLTVHSQPPNSGTTVQYDYAAPPVDSWHMFLSTTSTQGTTIYIDGKPKSSMPFYISNTFVNGTDLVAGAAVNINGIGPLTDDNGGYFQGQLDDIRIYNRALNQPEIDSLYDEGDWNDLLAYYPFNGNANDESGHGNNGTVVGAILDKDRFSADSAAYRFTGSSYITIPELFQANQSAFTISAWVTTEELNAIDHAAFYKGSVEGEVGFGISDSTFGLGVKLADNQWYYLYSPNPQELNKYYHFLARYTKGSTIDFWINGELSGTMSIPDLDLYVLNPGTTSSIGAVYGGSQYFWRGIIDDIRIYSRAISEDEIRWLYHDKGWDYPKPSILSIKDIPGDQGGKVRIQWTRADFDSNGTEPQVISYGVWRKIPQGTTPKIRPSGVEAIANDTLGTLYDFMGGVTAIQSPQYNFVASTLYDSSASGSHAEQYLVTAHTIDPNKYSVSGIALGYSVDNLPPIPPTGLQATVQSDSLVKLIWNSPTDPDVTHYEVHRSIVNGFIPDALTKIGSSTNLEFADSLPKIGVENYYRIIAVDVHDNVSQPSPTVGAGVTTTQTVNIRDKWNIVSVPLTMGDYGKSVLYPTAISNAFAYEGTYVAYGIMKNATGYWLKFNGAQTIPLSGLLRSSDTVVVTQGWNLVGSISAPIGTSDVTSLPSGLTTSKFFEYIGNYQTIDTIKPGSGYWVKVNQPGKLILSSLSAASSSVRIKIASTSELPPSPPNEISSERAPVPTAFALAQNYPNPFNPVTTISYDLPVGGHVRLSIYDMLGKEVANLVNGEESPGYKTISYDASGLPSGVYVYRISVGTFLAQMKLLLVK